MSRGLGRIERWILDEIERRAVPDITGHSRPVLVNSWGLACNFDEGRFSDFDAKPSRAQRVAVARAMHSFVRKFPQYALTGGRGRKMLYLYEPGDSLSAAWAEMSVAKGFLSLSELKTTLRAAEQTGTQSV